MTRHAPVHQRLCLIWQLLVDAVSADRLYRGLTASICLFPGSPGTRVTLLDGLIYVVLRAPSVAFLPSAVIKAMTVCLLDRFVHVRNTAIDCCATLVNATTGGHFSESCLPGRSCESDFLKALSRRMLSRVSSLKLQKIMLSIQKCLMTGQLPYIDSDRMLRYRSIYTRPVATPVDTRLKKRVKPEERTPVPQEPALHTVTYMDLHSLPCLRRSARSPSCDNDETHFNDQPVNNRMWYAEKQHDSDVSGYSRPPRIGRNQCSLPIASQGHTSRRDRFGQREISPSPMCRYFPDNGDVHPEGRLFCASRSTPFKPHINDCYHHHVVRSSSYWPSLKSQSRMKQKMTPRLGYEVPHSIYNLPPLGHNRNASKNNRSTRRKSQNVSQGRCSIGECSDNGQQISHRKTVPPIFHPAEQTSPKTARKNEALKSANRRYVENGGCRKYNPWKRMHSEQREYRAARKTRRGMPLRLPLPRSHAETAPVETPRSSRQSTSSDRSDRLTRLAKVGRRITPRLVMSGSPRSLDAIASLIGSDEWEEQLAGLEAFQKMFAGDGTERAYISKNDHPFVPQLIKGFIKTVRSLRSQVARSSLQTLQLFLQVVKTSGERNLLVPQADQLIQTLLTRTDGDSSTKFLQQESIRCLNYITTTIDPTRSITILCNQFLSPARTRSALGRLSIAKLLLQVILDTTTQKTGGEGQYEVNKGNLNALLARLGPEKVGWLMSTCSKLLDDGGMEARKCGHEAFKILARSADIEQSARKALSEQTWQRIKRRLKIHGGQPPT